ncbi:MAG: hypothetical protein F6J99_32370 [Moorea sp. SIO4G3]|nr:hypothetical protein [Moorena sp. SIO4G3]NEO80662.1 hypothetical protein [Moorena sp. SIO4G3]
MTSNSVTWSESKNTLSKPDIRCKRVDTKNKELIGNFKNPGQEWTQQAEAVNDHDEPKDALAKAVPYGIYDLVHNQGYVYVGTSGDTAAFAVDAIVRWFKRFDRPRAS